MLNKVYFNVFAVLLICVSFTVSRKPIAPYIKPCSKSAPDFDECCLAHGKESLPFILKGDKEYKIPNFTPFVIPFVSLDNSGLKVSSKDLHIYGLDKNELKQVKFDFNSKKISAKVLFEKIHLIGDFIIDGKLLMFSLKGSGKANITADAVDVIYIINYKLEEREGEEYFAIDSATSDFTCEMVYFHINIFDGNKELGETTNKALNENWRETLETFKPAIAEIIVNIGNVIINAVGATVPFKEIFLD